ncbi:hypothetical protein AXG94_04825 [Pseudomonas corrugata]|nr:hypothetical protein AXG94_04825 [Pseudomonas corrugata]
MTEGCTVIGDQGGVDNGVFLEQQQTLAGQMLVNRFKTAIASAAGFRASGEIEIGLCIDDLLHNKPRAVSPGRGWPLIRGHYARIEQATEPC